MTHRSATNLLPALAVLLAGCVGHRPPPAPPERQLPQTRYVRDSLLARSLLSDFHRAVSADLAGRCVTALQVAAPALPWTEERRRLDAQSAINLLPSRGDRLVARVVATVAIALAILAMLALR